MVLHDWECQRGHIFEKVTPSSQEWVICKVKLRNGHTCGKRAVVTYLPAGQRQLAEPIVFYKCRDGKFSFPGQANARAPRDAVERIECRTIGEYDRAMSRVNGAEASVAARRAEGLEQMNSAWRAEHRSRLISELARTTDSAAKDIIRRALAEKPSDREPLRFQRTFAECMEMDASNRERDLRGRK